MKILNSVSALYNKISPEADLLKKEVDRIVDSFRHPRWYYFSRVKSKESFALKLETGRIADPKNLEDFFAATIVVQNLAEIRLVYSEIEKEFEIVYRKPKTDNETSKEATNFPFDDLRLYLKIKTPDYMPQSSLNGNIFEMQIKTFLQHAWSISTHDLVYKADNISWAKTRVAFQIKAMLEQAELAISGAEHLSLLPELAKEDKKTLELKKVLGFLTKNFQREQLPTDLLRLSQITSDLLKNFKISIEELESLLVDENARGRGVNTLDLSPYAIMVSTIKNGDIIKFKNALKKSNRIKTDFIFIPREIDMTGFEINDRVVKI
ncbi:hypothetical protein [Pedobacter miscanthi]|uniref:hypothetical protein n=1 Tax=Pedobacter miscanthi TaxID=2259170 RepID=UPI002931C3AA|nr:hypothetical protein [Pedobacter miscanthi]